MTKIGPVPPPSPSFEPEKPKKALKESKHHHTEEVHQSKSSHSRKLQRFGKTQVSAISAVKIAKSSLKASAPIVPVKNQWNENSGYCGETAFIAAGMMNGQYCSQYDARQMAFPNGNQTDDQLTVGNDDKNDITAANAMHLNYNEYTQSSPPNSQDFLNWIRSEISQGHPVAIGVFMNSSAFESSEADPEYDHIVTVTNITADTITFNDNGLYGDPPQETFQCSLKDFLQSRHSANAPNSPTYSLRNDGVDCGIAITGKISGPNTLPVSIAAPLNEDPEIADGSNERPVSSGVPLTVTISDLVPGHTYKIYSFRNFNDVPTPPNFVYPTAGYTTYTAPPGATTYTFPDTIQPDQNGATTVIYRVIPN